MEWGCTSHPGAIIQAPKDPFLDTPTIRAWTPVTDEVSEEVDTTIDSIRALYSSSWLESMSTPRNVIFPHGVFPRPDHLFYVENIDPPRGQRRPRERNTRQVIRVGAEFGGPGFPTFTGPLYL